MPRVPANTEYRVSAAFRKRILAIMEDNDCFSKIEAIVCLLEEMGIDTGNRHDFG